MSDISNLQVGFNSTKTSLSIILLLCCLLPRIHAQSDSDIPIQVFKSNRDTLTIQEIIQRNRTMTWSDPDDLTRSHPTDIYWIKLDLEYQRDVLQENQEWFLKIGSSERSTLYYESHGEIKKRPFGFLAPLGEHKPTLFYHDVYFNSDELIDGRFLYMKVQMLAAKRNVSRLSARLIPKHVADENLTSQLHELQKSRTPTFIFVGIILIVLLFAITAFIDQKKLEYLYYSFYLISLALYLGRRAFGLHDSLLGQYPLLEYITHMELQVFINLFYVLFAKYFLNTSRDYPILDRAINVIVVLLSIFIIADILAIYLDQFGLHLTMMDLHRYVMSIFGVTASIYLLIKAKSKLVYFIVVGSFSYTVGALGMLFLVNNTYMIVGSSIEIFVFTLGLGYKSRQLLLDNNRIQQDVLQLKMSALRAQMNPHFIFNSLGSIQHLIRSDKRDDALSYLSKFSKLLRQILETSINVQVTLKEEIDLLKNYIELESLRFDGAFSYEILVDDEVDADNFEIPILLLQPYVENAIIHGLLQKEGEAKLSLHFSQENEHLLCIIEDNGIGRGQSAENKRGESVQHKSRGLGLVEKRLNELDSDSEPSILVEDLFDAEGQSIGTRISIKIPSEY